MSEIRTNLLKSERGDASPSAPFGLRVSGVTTTGTLNVTGSATISGNLGVAGTITYEDVARIDATGISTFREGFGVGPLAGIALTAYKDGSIRTSGIVTAASFVGDGSALTGLAGLSLSNGVDNRLVTCVNATSMQGESSLFYQGDYLTQLTDSDQEGIRLISSGNTGSVLDFDANRDTDNRHLGEVRGKWNGAEVCRITLSSGADTTNKDEGKLVFHTKPSSGGIAERLRIESGGQFGIGGANYGTAGQFLTSGGPSSPPSWSSLINQNAVSAPTGASEYIWTGIPSTAREITFTWYNIVPAASSNNLWVQVGHSGGIQGSGYGTISGYIISGNQSNGAATHWGASSGAKFMIAQDWHATNVKRYGTFVLRKHDTANMWIGTGSYWIHDASDWVRAWGYLNGYVSIANLDRFRVYNSAGANWASGGTFNCYWY